MIYLQLFLSFLQIGALSFGGGYAAMPLIQAQIVTEHQWLSMSEFTDLVTIAEMTPGPIAVNSATFVGTKIAGDSGGAGGYRWLHSPRLHSGDADCKALPKVPQYRGLAERPRLTASGGGRHDRFGGGADSAQCLLERRDPSFRNELEYGRPVRRGVSAPAEDKAQSHSGDAAGGSGQSGHIPDYTVKNLEKTTSAADRTPMLGVSATGRMRVSFLPRYSAFALISRWSRPIRSSCRQQMSPAR